MERSGKWLKRFRHGKIDAHKAFIKYGQEYEWLYENSPYDLIGREIDNGFSTGINIVIM
ncbi:MAG: hypothetical protein LDL10_00945 [Calditerrivibrio sp.]|nr:hypothetical protein [Calditerrivibrio sp.]